MKHQLIFIVLIIFGVSCTQEPTLQLGTRGNVIVTLEIPESQEIQSINFSSSTTKNDSVFVTSDEIKGFQIVTYTFDCISEGSFWVCVNLNSDTVCSGGYVEKGYRPLLRFDSKEIDIKEFF